MAYVGIDLGGTQVRIAVADGKGRIRAVVRRPSHATEGQERVTERIAALIAEALRMAHVDRRHVRALGIGLPGPVDPRLGIVHFAPNLPGWNEVPLNAILTRMTGIPSYLHHDAHLAAFAELRHGVAKGVRDLAYVTVSTGIGAGLVLDGQLYGGAHGGAGEFGHIVIQRDGPRCPCGNRGCLEALASGTAIAREAREAVERGVSSSLGRIPSPGPTAKDVDRAARAGDPLARGLLEDAGTALGIGLGTLVNLLNPQMIVIGGSVMKAGRVLTDPMQVSLTQSSWPSNRASLRLVRPRLGADVGLVGAIEWARFRAEP
jgi:glucokinase